MKTKLRTAPGLRIDKIQVATELLDRALQMYFDQAFFASIHLAGAAEELFGAYLTLWQAGRPAADSFHDDAASVLGFGPSEVPKDVSRQLYSLIFRSRNRTKHLNAEGDHEIMFDPLLEAETVLNRALENFYAAADVLGLRPTRRMYRFNRERFTD
jgi:hypothetical protein